MQPWEVQQWANSLVAEGAHDGILGYRAWDYLHTPSSRAEILRLIAHRVLHWEMSQPS